MIRVLAVDDQPLVLAGLRVILNGQPDLELAGEASNGEEAVEAARRLEPDVILMDIRMPRMDGLEAIRRITAAGRCKILVLTTFDVDDYVYTAIAGGASGFLLKEAPPEELLAAIRVVAAGDSLVSPSSTRRLIERHMPAPQRPTGKVADLTAREQEVLTLVARGLSNAEVAATLHLSEGTVKTHVTHILTKLDVRDRLQAVVVAYETGLVTPGER